MGLIQWITMGRRGLDAQERLMLVRVEQQSILKLQISVPGHRAYVTPIHAVCALGPSSVEQLGFLPLSLIPYLGPDGLS
jgi:hypothetical protein